MRNLTLALAAVSLGLVTLTPAAAHHGWAWATDKQYFLNGTVKKVRHGNPHGEMVLTTTSGDWKVEIGQPWRNERAGLTPAMLKPGTKLRVHGHRAEPWTVRLMKAERIVVAGKSFNLYPDRSS